ncbi:hypothetical protein MUA01_17555 [Enterobacteriaceae bacterium H18W14]|uniref:hypothetical protein n=1 Tax=Dryocola boscaweniae TaxID=2925397 RepID=UPI0022F00D20|nr:hypothetical protein [Dryocola boscaweniae]MCT4716765.1 hypothetical protein [Dryocola boscaweniae]
MKYRKEIDNDYAFGRGDAAFLNDSAQAVAQAVKTRLSLWRGEWFLDTAEGTPYVQSVLGKHSEDIYSLAIRDRISGTQGVKSITAFNTQNNSNTRRLTYSVTLDTLYGEVTVDV